MVGLKWDRRKDAPVLKSISGLEKIEFLKKQLWHMQRWPDFQPETEVLDQIVRIAGQCELVRLSRSQQPFTPERLAQQAEALL